jgi:gluconate 5-dehydrogenase
MTSKFSLEGKRALVTGGGSGIGLAISQGIVENGGSVVIVGRREELLKEACDSMGPMASYMIHDVTDLPGNVEFARKLEEGGPVDILVNNAGQNIKKTVLETTDEIFHNILEVNLIAVFSLTREIGRYMLERKRGAIINIASMTSLFGIPFVSAYTSSKAAVAGLTKQLATEFSPCGITVNAVAPGFIDTAMSRKAFEGDPERKRKVLSRTPMNELGLPEDVANAVVFLASPAARYLTGVILPVDGGTSIGF